MSQYISQESYALCLVAHIYRCYKKKDPVLNYPESDLPVSIIYCKPRSAEESLLNAQCKVNRALREYLVPVFDRIYRESCENCETFKSFMDNSRFHQLIGGQRVEYTISMKLLAHFALATELVLYCFRKKCYRLANYLPKYIETVLKSEEFENIFTTLTDEDVSEVDRANMGSYPITDESLLERIENLPSNKYKRLREYSLLLDKRETHWSASTFRTIGTTFKEEQLELLGPEPEPSNEPGERAQGQNCDICGEYKCQKYLVDFMLRCAEKYGESSSCTTGCC